MLYRRFPKIPNKEFSVLGFGLMRLPIIGEKTECIDIEKTTDLIKLAYEQGITYFDTAYPYHGGQSEVAFGKALKILGIRDKITIADKLPIWLVNEESDLERLFNEQLERLQTDYIDFYLLHALNADYWSRAKKMNALTFLEQKKKEGKIRHVGFSFHDDFDMFKQIVDEYAGWEFCQVQYNYLDYNTLQTEQCIEYASKHGLGCIAMEPLRGGSLANTPQGVTDIFANAAKPRMGAEWALRWVWENQNITCAISGINEPEHIIMNCATASSARPNSLPTSQLEVVKKAEAWYKERMKVSCTLCRYCDPCPSGVQIPYLFSEWNSISLKGGYENGIERVLSTTYAKMIQNAGDATKCIDCGACEQKCPQKLTIMKLLKQAHTAMTIE